MRAGPMGDHYRFKASISVFSSARGLCTLLSGMPKLLRRMTKSGLTQLCSREQPVEDITSQIAVRADTIKSLLQHNYRVA